MPLQRLLKVCASIIVTINLFCSCSPLFQCPCPAHLTDSLTRYPNISDEDHIFSNYESIIHARIQHLTNLMHSDSIYKKVPQIPGGSDSITLWQQFYLTKRALIRICQGIEKIKRSNVRYHLFYTAGNFALPGVTTADPYSGEILISYKKGTPVTDEVIGHEIMHAIQYEKRKVSIGIKQGESHGSLYDISDETEAYWYARVTKYNLSDGDSVTDAWVMKKYPEYNGLPTRHVSIHSKIGRELRRNTTHAGAGNIPASELYKGWEKDYAKGCKQLAGKTGKIPATGPCSVILKSQPLPIVP